jgi:Mg2+ and Co2+ transporter CorA
MICIVTTTGCVSQNELSEGQTWSEATRNSLTQSEIELITEAGIPPDEIDAESKAIRACTIIGWTRALESVERSELQPVESFLQTASETEQTLSEVETTLSEIDQLITDMKETEYRGISAWDIAISLSSSMRTFDTAVSTSLREVRDWLRLFSAVTETLSQSLEIIRTQIESQRGRPERILTLDDNIDDSLENLTELETRSSDIRQNLSSFAETTATVAANDDEFRTLGEQVELVFGEASTLFADAASDLQQFITELRAARSSLAALETEAEETRTEVLNEIRSRVSPG